MNNTQNWHKKRIKDLESLRETEDYENSKRFRRDIDNQIENHQDALGYNSSSSSSNDNSSSSSSNDNSSSSSSNDDKNGN